MVKTDTHKEHSYSHDYLLLTYLRHELNNHLRLKETQSQEIEIVKLYFKRRIEEIEKRWK